MAPTHARSLPQPTDITRPYWEAASAGRLIIQQCQRCRTRQFYPRGFCTACMSEELDWVNCSGKGKIYTFTINHRAPNAFMKNRLPYAVAAIDLEEGGRMLANIIGSPLDQIAIGARVSVVFEDTNEGITLPQFTLASSA